MEQNQNKATDTDYYKNKAEIDAVVLAVVEFENVYATKLLRIGDEVVMNMDKEARGWGREGVPDGTKGTVVGFFEYYTTKHLNMQAMPGIYRGNGAAVVKWETGEVDTHGSDLAMPKHILDERRKDNVWNEAFDNQVRQYDLPKFDYMVGNKIAYTWKPDPRHGGRRTPEREVATITFIGFDEIVERRTGRLLDVEKWKDDRIIHVDIEGGGSTRVSISEIDFIIEQGNYWAWLNDKTQLKFKDLREEVGFYASLGLRKQIRSARSGDYKWTQADSVEAIRRGDVDVLGNSGSFFGSEPFPVVYKLDESLADLAKRVREETMKGFADFEIGERPNRRYEVVYTLPGTEYTIKATKEFESSIYIQPPEEKNFKLEGYDYVIVPNYRLHDDDNDPVTLSPMVLDPNYPIVPDGKGGEIKIDLNDEVRTEMALHFFNKLAAQGWIVDDSKFIKQK